LSIILHLGPSQRSLTISSTLHRRVAGNAVSNTNRQQRPPSLKSLLTTTTWQLLNLRQVAESVWIRDWNCHISTLGITTRNRINMKKREILNFCCFTTFFTRIAQHSHGIDTWKPSPIFQMHSWRMSCTFRDTVKRNSYYDAKWKWFCLLNSKWLCWPECSAETISKRHLPWSMTLAFEAENICNREISNKPHCRITRYSFLIDE